MLLPIESYKDQIVEMVKKNDITIITAETGAGKSTQVPRYLSECYGKIVVTEPRVMAAKNLAMRVSYEMGTELGKEVGYRTAYDCCVSDDSKITYCTDGYFLPWSLFNNTKEDILIIDEVHEWNLSMETLIAWVKLTGRKCVIMSATINQDEIASFFKGENVGILNVPGNLFDVEIKERYEEELIPTIQNAISRNKNILVFVPGKKEIQEVCEKLYGRDATVLPLHGEMDWDNQKKCFEKYDNPKVVVATNVAQTSITIPDIDVVVDTGKARISKAYNGVQSIELVDVSQADILQRKGRAGRTKDGEYYLCSYWKFDQREEFEVPEIQRSILDRVVLQIAAVGLNANQLEFIHQPSEAKIIMAQMELRRLGALDAENNITELGKQMVRIPVSPQFARMIIEAQKYGVTEQILTISAIVEIGGLLAKGGKYYSFTREHESDLIAELEVWQKLYQMGYIQNFESLGINKKNFFRIKDHIKKLHQILDDIVEMKHEDNRQGIIKSCLAGLVSRFFVCKYGETYLGEDGERREIDRKSCVRSGNVVAGIPKTICGYEILSMVTNIDIDTLLEFAPEQVSIKYKETYSWGEDAVKIEKTVMFRDTTIEYDYYYQKEHPRYEELKAEYESKYHIKTKQEKIKVGGKLFDVHYDYFRKNRAYIYIDNETLFNCEENRLYLDNGQEVMLMTSSFITHRAENSIKALRNAVENIRIAELVKKKKAEYKFIKVDGLEDIYKKSELLGKIQITTNNGGYGKEPIFVYGYLKLEKNILVLEVGYSSKAEEMQKIEEDAIEYTKEALQFQFIKELEKKLGYKFGASSEKKGGKKHKKANPQEAKIRDEFESLVRDLMQEITAKNALDNLEFAIEYYSELAE